MDDQEQTAWEEINPTMALARTPARPTRSLAPWENPDLVLRPADREDFRRELTACLSLVAPAGMNETARSEWLLVAWNTLNGIPADLLERGCLHARKVADHPAKIVPAILAEVEGSWESRKRQFAVRPSEGYALPAPMANVCRPEEARAIMDEVGIPEMDAPKRTLGPLRKPTRADYIALGVDPAILDSMETPA